VNLRTYLTNSAVSRFFHGLFAGLLLLIPSCKAQAVDRWRDPIPQKLLTWPLGADKQQQLATALYRAGRVREPAVASLQRFYYYPAVTNRRGEGLYYVTTFSHRGPMGVLNSKQGLSTVENGPTARATQDSLAAALVLHGNRFSQRLSQSILDEYLR
jgi:hypothetical protein